MVDESIVIEVKDSVENSIAVKIKAIATEARLAHKDLGTLQKQLSALGVSKLGGVSSGASGAATATAKLATAQANLSTATARLQSAQNQAALSAQRLADAQDRAQKRTASAAQAATTATVSAQKLSVAQSTNADTTQIAASKFIASLKAQNDAIGKSRIELLEMKAAQLGVTAQSAQYIAALKKQDVGMGLAGKTTKEYNAAMRGVPAQITDIVVSLQGGQAPLTVLLQQGGQLKDMFGGIIPAVKALGRGLLALINPYTILAGILGSLAFGFLKGRQELIDFNKENTITGNTLAITSSRFYELQANLSNIGTKGKAADTLTEVAKAGNLAGMNIENISRTAILMEKATGQSISKTIDQFQKLADSPAKASLELNKTYNFLTLAVYDQIKALEKQGRAVEAANVAEKAFSDTMQSRTQTVVTNAGYMEQAWLKVGGAVKWAIDQIAGIGRESDPLAEVRKKLDYYTNPNNFTNGTSLNDPRIKATVAALKEQLAYASETERMLQRSAETQASDQARQKAGIAAADRIDSLTASTASNQTKLTKALSDYRRDLETIRGLPQTDETRKRLDPKIISATEANIRDTFKTAKSPETKKLESRSLALEKIKLQLENELSLQNMLGDAREKEEMFNRINEGLIGRGIVLTTSGINNETKAIKDKIAAYVEGAPVASEAIRINEEANGAQLQYNATITAANELLTYGVITQDQYNKAATLASETIKNAQDPLRQFNKELDNQFALSKLTNKESEIESYMQGISNDLLAKGIDLKTTDNQTILKGVEALRTRKTELLTDVDLQSAVKRIAEQTTGALDKLILETKALGLAHKAGSIDADQYSLRLVKLGVDAANIRLSMGIGTENDMALGAIGSLLEGYEGALAGLSSSFGDFFTQIEDGFSRSIGDAIVKSESLGDALHNVAQSALSALIGSLVKVGVQYVVNEALGKSSAASVAAAQIAATTATTAASVAGIATTTTASTTAATATATAWTPAALLTSIGSFGQAAAIGIGALLAAKSLFGFEKGGYTGNMATDAVAGVVHGQEFVMTAAATRENRPMLEAMNRGAKAVGSNSIVGTGNNSGVNVTIENYGTSKDFEVQQLSETEIRIIARNEAKGVVQKDAPNVVAAQIRNPNSSVSKSLGQSTQTQRRR